MAGTTYAVLSDSNGDYRIVVPTEAFPSGELRILATMLGFERAEVPVSRNSTGTVRVDLQLRPAVLALQELVVVSYDQRVRNSEAAVGPPTTGAATGFVGGYAGPASAPADWNRESYAHISENAFRAAADAPLSTFSIDVDRASYSNVRRFLLEGRLPPTDAVRIEEMVNYFNYEYPTSRGEHPFAVTTELGQAPWSEGHQILRIGLASQPMDLEELPFSNFVFLLDVSGSMNSPDKLPLVKQSLRLLVNELRPRDRVAIVVYAGAAGLVLPSTPGNQKARILSAIEALEAGGSTAGGAGLRLAYRIAEENHLSGGNNRVILATDGDFNVGVSSDSEMVRLVTERRAKGTFLTVLGFGTGNLQDTKMEQMAQHGNGNYAYIDSLLEARKVLVTEMGGTLVTVASDVKLQVEFNPARVASYRLIGYENRLLAPEDFNDDQRDAGELGAGHVVTALYEIVPVGIESEVQPGRVDPLRYQQPASVTPAPLASEEIAFVRVRYKQPGRNRSLLLEQPVTGRMGRRTADFDFATAVAGFGMLLRNSEHRGSIDVRQILALATAGRGSDEHGHRAEFVRLVELYRGIASADRHGGDDR
jgi:Ca-activated chloride channel family protein